MWEFSLLNNFLDKQHPWKLNPQICTEERLATVITIGCFHPQKFIREKFYPWNIVTMKISAFTVVKNLYYNTSDYNHSNFMQSICFSYIYTIRIVIGVLFVFPMWLIKLLNRGWVIYTSGINSGGAKTVSLLVCMVTVQRTAFSMKWLVWMVWVMKDHPQIKDHAQIQDRGSGVWKNNRPVFYLRKYSTCLQWVKSLEVYCLQDRYVTVCQWKIPMVFHQWCIKSTQS